MLDIWSYGKPDNIFQAFIFVDWETSESRIIYFNIGGKPINLTY